MTFKDLNIWSKIGIILLSMIIIYAIIWIGYYFACKLSIGDLEPCIWNLREHWFPLPKCVCVN